MYMKISLNIMRIVLNYVQRTKA